jgi:hypothetical protein
MLLDDLIAIICKPGVFERFFSQAFIRLFPLGHEHLRCTLLRLVPIRNALSHSNGLSTRDAAQVFCYCDDVVASLVDFYAVSGMSKDFDAPIFTKFSDSLGNVEHLRDHRNGFDYSNGVALRVGDYIRFEVEVDAHYIPSEYSIEWSVCNISNGETGVGTSFTVVLAPRHVNEMFAVQALLKSNREWHRMGNFDSYFTLNYKVLPPL